MESVLCSYWRWELKTPGNTRLLQKTIWGGQRVRLNSQSEVSLSHNAPELYILFCISIHAYQQSGQIFFFFSNGCCCLSLQNTHKMAQTRKLGIYKPCFSKSWAKLRKSQHLQTAILIILLQTSIIKCLFYSPSHPGSLSYKKRGLTLFALKPTSFAQPCFWLYSANSCNRS